MTGKKRPHNAAEQYVGSANGVLHFTPPLHIKTSACGWTADDCFSDSQARERLAAIGIADPDHITVEQIREAAESRWCVLCLLWGFSDSAQLRKVGVNA